jgi:5-methylcytosine-specific restriction endonuclease McrA
VKYTDRSSGQKYSQHQIDRYIGRACKILFYNQRDEYGYNFCEKCKKNHTSVKLDCSHIKSRKKCKEDGEIKKLWSMDNLQVLCRDCHKKYDGLDLQFTKEENR